MLGGAGSDALKWSAEFIKMKSPDLRRPGLNGPKAGQCRYVLGCCLITSIPFLSVNR